MLLVATLCMDATTVPAPDRAQAAQRAVAALARLARQHELVIVADWPDRGWTVRSLVDALTNALPWHEVVLVAARTDTHGRHAGGIGNVPTVRRLVDDGAVVICLAGGPGRDRTQPVATALAAALRADRIIRVAVGEPAVAYQHHDVQVTRAPAASRRRPPASSRAASARRTLPTAGPVVSAPPAAKLPGTARAAGSVPRPWGSGTPRDGTVGRTAAG